MFKKILESRFEILNGTIFVLFCAFLFGEFGYKITAVKNITLYLAFALLLFGICWKSKFYEEIYKQNFRQNFVVIILVFTFIIYALTVSYFSYSGNILTFKKAFSQFLRVWIAIFIAFSFKQDEKKGKIVFFVILFAFLVTTIYDVRYYIDFESLKANLVSAKFIEKTRMYARFVDMYLVFGIFGFFIIKNWFLKFPIFLAGVLLPLIMLILTGARGGYVAAVVTIFLSICFLFFTPFFKKKFLILISLLFIILTALVCTYYAYNNYPYIKRKMTQTTSSGRDMILQDRLPLLLQSNRAYFGLGFVPNSYVKYSEYDAFLRDKQGEGHKIRLGRYDTKYKQNYWLHDEPTYIGYLYEYGFIGTGIFALLSLSLLGLSLKRFISSRSLIYASVFVSFFSYYIIRGLFETQPIFYALYLSAFFILIKQDKKVE